ncbi:SulP family inorganic anion transporter [Marinobacter sp. X15-166B]|uniref:SulP family inorganic anion transporter n=1 Tax=Marinobacter sp. X15-166B TaxID=1897620 RepID=UPI00085C8DB1|nr:sulfate permease [Marinobacter sp. X15-166B]OEY66254.1 sodium-independent anion transporter [Marinobacter sp. X15-166B]
MNLKRYLPALQWLSDYQRSTFANDLLAGVIMTVVLIPQSLAYAMLAGLPAHVGLYASIFPPILYAFFGTSRTLAVGPVAVTALMTAAALGGVVAPGSPEYMAAALLLAVMSGLMLLVMGLLRLGFVANFLSHPVVSGFVSASGILIVASQLGSLTGIATSGHNLLTLGGSLIAGWATLNLPTLVLGAGVLAFLMFTRTRLKPLLVAMGLAPALAGMLVRVAPVVAVAITTALALTWQLADAGVVLVGSVPTGLPGLTLPSLDPQHWKNMALSALLISVVSFISSVSVAQTFAAKRRQRIDPDQELIALGAANLGAGFSGGMPVTGGMSRTVVSYDSGAETPASGVFTAAGLALVTLTLTQALAFLPVATLAAIIMIAAATLVDVPALVRTWHYAKADFVAMLATIVLTLGHSLDAGLVAGVGLSLALYLYRTSRPHVALVGRVPGTEHFRNVLRHQVETRPTLGMLRVDESLYFANSRFLEEAVLELVSRYPEMTDLVLVCSGANLIDASALASLEGIHERLADASIKLHLSEVKGPVMDRLQRTEFLEKLSGRVYLSTFQAWCELG